jgi:hypothetical protein
MRNSIAKNNEKMVESASRVPPYYGRSLRLTAFTALQSLDPNSQRWTMRVMAIGSGYWRVVGEAHDLIAIAERLGQRWIKGLGLAKRLARPA